LPDTTIALGASVTRALPKKGHAGAVPAIGACRAHAKATSRIGRTPR